MKTKFTLLALFIAAFSISNAQYNPVIPNGGFNRWTSPLNPDGWATLESIFGMPMGFASEDTVDFVEGTASIKLMSDTVAGQPQAGTQPGIVSLGTGAYVPGNLSFTGIPFKFRPDTLFFAYKYTSPGRDTASIQLIMLKTGSSPVFAGRVPLDTTSQWVGAYLPLDAYYSSASVPDTLLLQFASSSAAPVIGSTFHVDAVSFGYRTCTATATAGGPTTFCQGDSVSLQANGSGVNYQYQWFKNGSPISGANSATYTAADSGVYFVLVDSAGKPGVSAPVTVTTTVCLGIQTIEGVSMNVYPNPTSGVLNVTSDKNLSGFNFVAYDLVGNVVAIQTLEGATNSINISHLSNGTYIYRIADKETGSAYQSKFVVIK
jgi:hypothetical protein